ncbi:MAG: 50S ribosomal protein L16 [Nanoarchaeota archaeon]|nr:50S ribosomal protein L16 [Nanoarchaeota archaeon]
MALRKAGSYSKKYARPYTRKSKVKQKSYIKAVPYSKVVKLRMGDLEGYAKGKYPITLNVYSVDALQIRDNAIESIRQYLHRFLAELVGKDYYFEIKIYPHHILRENKMITGAGADRMQTGMALSFGKTMGRAALVKKGQLLFFVSLLNQKHESIARDLINSAKVKMPGKIHVETIKKK